MVKWNDGTYEIRNGMPVRCDAETSPDEGWGKTMAGKILSAHSAREDSLAVSFDSLISHDITYVGIIQTAVASGLKEFPIPYVLTNCHNSLCAVGGTINADDHAFGLSAAKKYGGIYVPSNMAVIHQYAREELSGCGKMILGSDSHTRYGALGTMGVGEGGPELVKQLLGDTWDSPRPEIILVWVTGTPPKGVGPHDAAIAMCGSVYKKNLVKNKVLEFAGPGIQNLSMDWRIGLDVMTTETACLSSIWETDWRVEEYYSVHKRQHDYKTMKPAEGARYAGMIELNLSLLEPMVALPFHPSEALTIHDLQENAGDALREVERHIEHQYGGKVSMSLTDCLVHGQIKIEQGVIAGCAGGMYDNLAEAAAILRGHEMGVDGFELTVYPPSIPVQLEIARSGILEQLTVAGAIAKPCFCGPCFGAGDVPANGTISARHTTRNFPNREGSRPGDGQLAAVFLMDARSIAATARNHGILSAATDVDYIPPTQSVRQYDTSPYAHRVYYGFGKPETTTKLRFGPNIVPWPKFPRLSRHLLLELASVIHDPVTTTDELIPSGETSSYRSNPIKLASFTLSRRDPSYVSRAKKIAEAEEVRAAGARDNGFERDIRLCGYNPEELGETHIGSAIFAEKPGDGSAREQAASCQRVLGGSANICREYATKRYRSNCINWGMLPLTIAHETPFNYEPGDRIFLPEVREAIRKGDEKISGFMIRNNEAIPIEFLLLGFSKEEREIVLAGCLMNWYAQRG